MRLAWRTRKQVEVVAERTESSEGQVWPMTFEQCPMAPVLGLEVSRMSRNPPGRSSARTHRSAASA